MARAAKVTTKRSDIGTVLIPRVDRVEITIDAALAVSRTDGNGQDTTIAYFAPGEWVYVELRDT